MRWRYLKRVPYSGMRGFSASWFRYVGFASHLGAETSHNTHYARFASRKNPGARPACFRTPAPPLSVKR